MNQLRAELIKAGVITPEGRLKQCERLLIKWQETGSSKALIEYQRIRKELPYYLKRRV